MALQDYKGPSNNAEVFRHLVGERIAACFRDDEGLVWLVVESGTAIVLNASAFWKESRERVDDVVLKRRRDIERKLQELRDLPGVKLP